MTKFSSNSVTFMEHIPDSVKTCPDVGSSPSSHDGVRDIILMERLRVWREKKKNKTPVADAGPGS